VVLYECPRSYVTGCSATYLESYAVRKAYGGQPAETRSAKEIEAFVILDAEFAKEEARSALPNGRTAEGRRVLG
jgi:hypothetical protein